MEDYARLAKFYDVLIGNSSDYSLNLIKDFLNKYNPKGKSVLDIACGTGSILKRLSKNYECTGLDVSKEMLKIAKQKTEGVTFHHLDMVDFNLGKKFEVILCLFDSINHLLNFSDWKKLFLNVFNHLSSSGIFIFDMNSIEKMKRLSSSNKPIVKKIGNVVIIDTISKVNDSIISFDTLIIESDGTKSTVNIKETSFPEGQVEGGLNRYFNILNKLKIKNNLPSKDVERIYFVCSKKV